MREAVRNIASRPLLFLFWMLAVLAATGVVFGWEQRTVRDLAGEEAALRSGGFFTARVDRSGAFGGKVSTADCERLTDLRSVQAAAWVEGEATEWSVWNADGPATPVYSAGSSLRAVLIAGGQVPGQSIDLVVDQRSRLAEGSSDRPVLHHGSVEALTTRSVADLRFLGPPFEAAAVVSRGKPGPGSPVSCVAVIASSSRTAGLESLLTVFPAVDGYAVTYLLNSPDGLDDPFERYAGRSSRSGWLVALTVLVCAWQLTLRLRRHELVFYTLAGLRYDRLLRVILIEFALAALPSVLLVGTLILWTDRVPFIDGQAMRTGLVTTLRLLASLTVIISAQSLVQIVWVARKAPALAKDS